MSLFPTSRIATYLGNQYVLREMRKLDEAMKALIRRHQGHQLSFPNVPISRTRRERAVAAARHKRVMLAIKLLDRYALINLVKGTTNSMEVIGEEAVKAIKRGRWPVLTGFSKANFGYRVVHDPSRIQITNRARYADYVERRTGAATEALRKYNDQIVKTGGRAFIAQR